MSFFALCRDRVNQGSRHKISIYGGSRRLDPSDLVSRQLSLLPGPAYSASFPISGLPHTLTYHANSLRTSSRSNVVHLAGEILCFALASHQDGCSNWRCVSCIRFTTSHTTTMLNLRIAPCLSAVLCVSVLSSRFDVGIVLTRLFSLP